jgi:hypothetical protein
VVRVFAALAVAVLLALPPDASAREREAPNPGPLVFAPAYKHVGDAVVQRASKPMRAAAAGTGQRRYSTPDGYSVAIQSSAAYPVDPVADQKLVDFLASRVHGSELGDLSVYVGAPLEIQQLCGGSSDVVACYAIDEARMYVPGESVRGIPVEYPLTHEYGHHIASWRSNAPWNALDWGAKRWASSKHVCANVRRRLLYPGNQGAHYWDDPGEGFADTYARLHYPKAPWSYNQLMRPDAASLNAIRQDVVNPWTAPRTRTFSGRVGPRRPKRSFKIRLQLDGDLRLRLDAPPGAVYEVSAETPGFAAGQRLRDGQEFGVEWCRRRKDADPITLTVRRRAGSGPFRLSVSWPG